MAFITENQKAAMIIEAGAKAAMSLEEIVKLEVDEWQQSQEYKDMIIGEKYYKGDADILQRKRLAIGDKGQLREISNLANNKLVHHFLRKLTDQKTGYLLSKPLSIQTKNKNKQYQDLLNDYFNKSFLRTLKNLGKESINKGKAWLHVYYNEQGELSFKKIPSEEIIPLWRDSDHTELDAVIRVYEVEAFEGKVKKTITKVEFWDRSGVTRWTYESGKLVLDVEAAEIASHFVVIDSEGKESPYNWQMPPFICFKYNDEEQPLIHFVKSLIDDYDKHKSDNANNLEDLPNSIYVIKNYDGEDLAEFRKNISLYRAAKVDGEGGIDTLDINIDVEAYKLHQEMNRKDIYEFGRGVDTQSDKFGNSPSGISLRFLYADLDMDCNTIETEFQSSLEELLWFIDQHLVNSGKGDYSQESVDFVFNRDILINESDTITDIKNSVGIVSDETLLANHPYVTDVQEEMDRIKKQQADDLEKAKNYTDLNKTNPDQNPNQNSKQNNNDQGSGGGA